MAVRGILALAEVVENKDTAINGSDSTRIGFGNNAAIIGNNQQRVWLQQGKQIQYNK